MGFACLASEFSLTYSITHALIHRKDISYGSVEAYLGR